MSGCVAPLFFDGRGYAPYCMQTAGFCLWVLCRLRFSSISCCLYITYRFVHYVPCIFSLPSRQIEFCQTRGRKRKEGVEQSQDVIAAQSLPPSPIPPCPTFLTTMRSLVSLGMLRLRKYGRPT